ncbi:MAG: CHAT domain-containing protein [Acidobacteriota bacterium]
MIHLNRPHSILCAILQSLLLAAPLSALPQADTHIEKGRPVEREMEGAETHSYKIALASGQYARVLVNQRGIDVVVALFAPDGAKLNEMDSPNGESGPELVSIIADKAGLYRLDVSSLDKNAPRGRYEAKIEELREATKKDQARIAAEKNFAEAVQLQLADGRITSVRKALEKYKSTLEVWRELRERRLEAMTLFQTGLAHARLEENQQAVEYFVQALDPVRAAGTRPQEARLLREIGLVYKQLSEREKAVEFHERALALWRELGDRNNEALQLCDTGHLYFWFGNPQKAQEYLNPALSLARSAGNRVIEAATLMNLGLTHWALNEQEKAVDFYEKALPLYRASGDRRGQAETLTNIGLAYSSLGEYQRSLAAYDRALELWQAIGHRRGQARTLLDTGKIYRETDQTERAMERFNQILRWGDSVDVGWRADALAEIGWIHLDRGDNRQAIECFTQAIALSHSNQMPLARLRSLYGLGHAHSSIGEYEKAMDYYNQMLVTREMTNRPFEPAARFSIARIYQQKGDRQKAIEQYNLALDLWRERKNKIGEANTLISISQLERERGNLDQAREQAASALRLDEEVRVTRLSEQSRASFYSLAVINHYEFYLDLLIELHRASPSAGYNRIALELSERTRERALLDLLAEDRDRIRQGVDAELIERERDLRRRLLAKAAQMERSGQQQALGREIENLLAQYRDLEAAIRAKSPRYAALTQPQSLASAEIQKLLDQDSLLLEYFLGEERSFLWAVTQSSLSFHELPKRAEISKLARRFYDAITARNKRIAGETAAAEQARIARSKAEFHRAAQELSRVLLSPVAGQLGQRRLLIVADGVLHYIPFAALPAPQASVVSSPSSVASRMQRTTDKGQQTIHPLIANHEIVSLPSISTLSILRREAASRQTVPKTVAVIADPVFTADDSRLSASKRVEQRGEAAARSYEKSLQEALRDTDLADAGSRLPRLVNTRREALSILALAEAQSRKRALDFDASRATASSPELGQYRIIHFATHGLLNDLHPELSGLVLSLVDEKGNPQDGFLRLIDVYNLDLPVELVVLSACRTGLGKEIRGEGLKGLTRGFMYAGASRVTASLWKVDDRATAELMKRFYEGMLLERMSPAAALRSAQVAMWKQRQWQDPYYWAAFVLYGEWK